MAPHNPITTAASFAPEPTIFTPAVYETLLTSIIGGNPFAASLTRFDSGKTNAIFGVITGYSGAAWINEADPKPDILTDSKSYSVTAAELAGIAMVSLRAVRDSAVDLEAEVKRTLRLFFGKMLDDGLLHGDGTPPNPQGVMEFADDSSGTDLWGAVNAAKGDIVGAGGNPTTVALPPGAISTEEARLDLDGRPIYNEGLSRYAGLEVVAVPALAPIEGLVYDASGMFLVVAEDFRIDTSLDYAPAFQRDSVALRVSGQFGVGVPVPAQSLRKLTIT